MRQIIREYVNECRVLTSQIGGLTSLLNTNNVALDNLVKKFKVLTTLFERGSGLTQKVKEYSTSFKKELESSRLSFLELEQTLKKKQEEITNLVEVLKSILGVLINLESSAGELIKRTKTLIPLALNTEIRAFHSKEEGRGLAIIARELSSLVNLSKVPIQELETSVNNLKGISQSAIKELDEAMLIGSASASALNSALKSLKSIDDLIKYQEKMTGEIENITSGFSVFQKGVNEKLETISRNLTTSLMTVDEISLIGAEIYSLAQILENFYDAGDYLSSTTKRHFNHLLNENVSALNRFSKETPALLFSSELHKDINKITNYLLELKNTISDTKKLNDSIATTINGVFDFQSQITRYFETADKVLINLNKFGNLLSDELSQLESNALAASKVFSKIKILSLFARLEESRSLSFQQLITPIIKEFTKLFSETDKVMFDLGDLISKSKSLVMLIKINENSQKGGGEFKKLDYTKIKLFFDNLVQVLEEKIICAREIQNLIDELKHNDASLNRMWCDYENVKIRVLKYRQKFEPLIKEKLEPFAIISKKLSISTNLSSEPLTLRGDLKTDTNSHQVIVNTSTGLFQFGNGADVILGLCENYNIAPDGTEYTFHLRKGLKFANGQRLRIEDIKEGIIRALCGPNSNFFEMISGAQDFLKTKNSDSIDIKIIAPNTLQVKLDYPFLPILSNLATNTADPYIEAEFPIGTGSFRVDSWEKGRQIGLVANDFYYEGRPGIDKIQFLIISDEEAYELFEKNLLDVYRPTEKSLQKIKAKSPELLCSVPELSIQFLAFHCQKYPFNNKLVRQAINYAIDRGKLVGDFLKESAIPAIGVFPPPMKVYNKKLKGYSYDPYKSKELLSEAGFPNGLPDTYPLDVSDSPPAIKRAEFVSKVLLEIGIKTVINPLPWHILLEKSYNGDSLISFQGWISDNGDPDNFLYPLFHTKSFGFPGNTFFFSNPEIDQMLDYARKIRNSNLRIELYRTIEEKILEEAPAVFLFHSLENIAIKRGIRGIRPHPLGITRLKYLHKIEEVVGVEREGLNKIYQYAQI